jgi:hypothetical protein
VGTIVLSAPPAQAVACGDGSLAFSGGEGTTTSPFLISTEADLVALRGGYTTTPSYYSCAYRQVNDINLASSWPHGIGFSTPGSALYKPFEGVYDGNGYALANLTINASAVSTSSQARELGFIGLSTSGSAAIRNLDLVNATITCGSQAQFAAMLVGQVYGAVERSSATGTINCAAAGDLARMGGLIGFTDGAVSNSWVSGTITVPTTYTFSPNSIGGVIGRSDAHASIQYVLGRVSIVNAAQAVWPGIVTGYNNSGAFLIVFAQSGLTAGLSSQVGAGSSSGAALKSASELQDITTYTGWSISAGRSTSTIWGIDPAINGGFPFLQELPVDHDPSQAPPPILQQLLPSVDGGCVIPGDGAFAYGAAVSGGWTLSWAQWPHGGTGGPVCTRTLVYVSRGWSVAD